VGRISSSLPCHELKTVPKSTPTPTPTPTQQLALPTKPGACHSSRCRRRRSTKTLLQKHEKLAAGAKNLRGVSESGLTNSTHFTEIHQNLMVSVGVNLKIAELLFINLKNLKNKKSGKNI
jgi:hypothetical protein